MKCTASILWVGIVAIPIAAIATFLLLPLWRWIERVLGVESVGHSGPATWCFVVTYGGVFAAGLFARVWVGGRRGAPIARRANEPRKQV